jgi:hypothetical protein
MSLFEKATKNPRRLKMYIYGETGTGKTVTALHFPQPAVIDTEHGTFHYGKFFDFDVIYTTNFREVDKIVDSLLEDTQGYKTLVIDPFSNIWDRMVDDHQTFLRKKKGIPSYEITGLDYRPLKNQIKRFVGKLNDLDMNIVMTARSKDIYSNEPGEFMKKIGTAPDGPKDLPTMFDVVMEITVDRDTGARTAHVFKDRTNSLPISFEFSYAKLTELFGIEDLEREPIIFDRKLKNLSGRNTTIKHKGKEIQTAGIISEQLKRLEALMKKMDQTTVMEKLQGDFGVASFLDLRKDEAELFISDISKENQEKSK